MPWHQHVWDLLSQAALTSLAISIFATLAVLVCRQPARRIRMIECSLAACMAAPCLGMLPGYPRWPLPWTLPVASVPAGEVRAEANVARGGGEELVEPGAKPDWSSMADKEAPRPVNEKRAPNVDLRAWVSGCYLAGVVSLVVWWLMGLAAWLRLVRQSQPAPPRVQEMWRESGPLIDSARILVSPVVAQPVTFTARRPVIVLPVDLCQSGEERALRWCLRHEWAHAVRGDAWSWSLATLARALFWYQPLVWWLRGHLRLCQDFVADAAAETEPVAVLDYAEFLTSRMSVEARMPYSAGLSILGSASEFSRRIVMLIENERRLEPTCPRSWSTGFALTTLLVVAISATVTPGPSESSGEDTAEVNAAPPAANAQETPQQEPAATTTAIDLHKIETMAVAEPRKIRTLEFDVFETRLSGELKGPPHIRFRADGARFFIEWFRGEKDDVVLLSAFDGDRYQRFENKHGYLTITRDPISPDSPHGFLHPFVVPYMWLVCNAKEGGNTLETVRNPDLWARRFQRATFVSTGEVDSLHCAIVGFPHPTHADITFLVSFVEALDWFPLKFERWVDSDGEKLLTSSVVVSKWKRLGPDKIIVPLEIQFLELGHDKVSYPMKTEFRVDESTLKINDKIDGEIFTIAPSRATHVFDNTRKRVKGPPNN